MNCRIWNNGLTTVFALFLHVLLCQAAEWRLPSTTINSRGVAEGVPVYSIVQDSLGMIWLGTRDGVMSYDGYETRNYGLPGLGRILRLEVRGDTIDVSCQRGVVPLLLSNGRYGDSGKPRAEDVEERLSRGRERQSAWTQRMFRRNVTARLDIDARDSYIGTGDSLILVERKTGRSLRRWQMPVVKSLLHSDTLLYIGTDDGLFLLSPDGNLEQRSHNALFPATSLAGDVVWCLFSDRNENIWIGTDNGVSIIERNPSIQWLSIPELTGGRRGNNIDNVLQDSYGRLWLGGTNGLILVEKLWQKGQTYRWYRMGDERFGIPHNRIHRVFEDSRGRIWVCSDGGLLLYDEHSGQMRLTDFIKQQNTWTYHISEEKGDRLAVVMADTTFILDGITFRIVGWRKTKELHPSTDKEKLFYTTEYFYATDRVGIADRNDIITAQHSGRAVFTSIRVGGRYVAGDTVRAKHVEVPFNQNNLIVTFSDFNYSAEHLVNYCYQIDDGQWQPLDHGYNKITLANLPIGNHKLRINQPALDGSGRYSTLSIRVLPPWYFTWPMQMLYALVFIALIVAVIVYLVQKKTLRLEREQREAMLGLARQKEKLLQRELMATVQNETEQPAAPSIDDAFLLRITQLIEANLDNPDLSAAMLSNLCDVNQKQLYRKTKQLTSMTTVEYIRHIRMQHAAKLLRGGNFTIAEIMYRVGFTNASYFSRAFTAAHGMTPSEYKKVGA